MADFETLKASIIDGDGDGALAETQALIRAGKGPREVIDEALLPAMEVVGERMGAGEVFIPEVLLSARTMQSCVDIVKPLLGADDSAAIATVVIGTVEGDMHDIGKNLVTMLLGSSSFDVIDLGKGVSTEAFIAAVEQHRPQILGMSSLLSTTLPCMKVVIEALEAAGLRDSVRVICGGAPVTEGYCEKIGADAYAPDAGTAVERCKELLAVAQG